MKKLYLLLPVAAFLAVGCSDMTTTPDLMEPELVAMYNSSTTVPLNPDHVGATNPGFEMGDCPTPPEGQEGWWGWHFVMPANNNFTSLSVTFEHAGTFSADPFPGTVFVAHPDNSHAYIWTPTPDVLLAGSATSDGVNDFFNLSHVCGGEYGKTLEVTKTADTEFIREHEWDIAKKIETENEYEHDGLPKIWLYTDGSGDETATWTVDVTYEGYEDRDFVLSGKIFITNISTDGLAKTITSIADYPGAAGDLDLECYDGDNVQFDPVADLPKEISWEESWVCKYRVAFGDVKPADGTNTAKVTVYGEMDPYVAEEDWAFGDPTTEINKTVTIKDLSDLFGEVELGTVTAPDGATFTYDKAFAWEDFGADGCGDFVYDNTAIIVETEQEASATLKVNVQCYVYDTAYAMGEDAICFIPAFSNWGWTNPIMPDSYTWDLWAGAAGCDTSKGTLVGSVTVVYDDGYVTVTFNVDAPYLLEETHVYAGYDMFPKDRRGNPTVALGAYTNQSPFDGSEVYVIAHAVVGIPDPTFGP